MVYEQSHGKKIDKGVPVCANSIHLQYEWNFSKIEFESFICISYFHNLFVFA